MLLAFLDIKWDGQITFGNVVTIITTVLAVSAIYWKQQIFNKTQEVSIDGIKEGIVNHRSITDSNSSQITLLRESHIKVSKDIEFIKGKVVEVDHRVMSVITEQRQVARNLAETEKKVIDKLEGSSSDDNS